MARVARPDLAFAVLALLFGVGFALTTPPLQAPDENRHLIRAYLIAGGQLVAIPYPGTPQHGVAAAEVPVSITRMPARLGPGIAFHPEVKQDFGRVAAEWRRALAPQDSEWHVLPSTYSPLVYLPQAASVAVGRLLGAPPIAYVYLGRLANLALYVALVLGALRLAPAHRWTLVMVALVPSSIFQAASLSADATTNALAWLFLAAVLGAAARTARIARRELGALVGLAALLGLLKPPAAMLSPLLLLLPSRRFAGRWQWLAASACALAAAALTAALWYAALTRLPLPTLEAGADAGAQLRGMLEDPVGFARLLATTVRADAGLYARTVVGVLGWLDTPLPAWIYPIWWAALVIVAVFDGGPVSPVRGARRALCLGLVVTSVLAVLTLIYLVNPVGADPIGGVQGRYFLPFVPLGLISLHRIGARGLPDRAAGLVAVFCAAVLAIAIGTTGLRYYGAP